MSTDVCERWMEDLIGPDRMATVLEVHDLTVTDDVTAKGADLAIGKLKQGERELALEKEQRCRPLLDELDQIRSPYLKAIDFLASVRRVLDNRLGAYRADLERKRQREQQQLLEAHRLKQQALVEQAAQARRAVESAKVLGDAAVLAKAEAKMERVELKAASLPGPIVLPPATSPMTLDDGSTQTQRAIKKPSLPGYDLAKKVSAGAPAFEGFDIAAWRHLFVVDLTAVNAELKSRGALPAPFTVVTEYSSVLRKG